MSWTVFVNSRSALAVENDNETRIASGSIGAVQMLSSADPAANLATVAERTAEAAERGVDLVVFPEATMRCFGRSLKEGRPQRDSKARKARRGAASRSDPQREGVGRGAGSMRNVAERGAVDESLDDSSGGGGRLEAGALVGVVETALAEALRLAAAAGRWEVVAQLAQELAARRQIPTSERASGDVPRIRHQNS